MDKIPTPKQVEALRNFGITEQEIQAMTFQDASKKIAELISGIKSKGNKLKQFKSQQQSQPQSFPKSAEKTNSETDTSVRPSLPINSEMPKGMSDPDLSRFIKEAKLFIVENFPPIKESEISVENHLLAVIVHGKLQMQWEKFEIKMAKAKMDYWGDK